MSTGTGRTQKHRKHPALAIFLSQAGLSRYRECGPMKPIMIDLRPSRREDKSQLLSPAPTTLQGNRQREEQLRVASVEPVLYQTWETLSLTQRYYRVQLHLETLIRKKSWPDLSPRALTVFLRLTTQVGAMSALTVCSVLAAEAEAN